MSFVEELEHRPKGGGIGLGEAELAAMVRGATEGEGFASVLKDFGTGAHIHLHSDASAAIGITQRQGLGKIRHLSVADLWIQQKIRRGEIAIAKVLGTLNSSDLLTKPMARPRFDALLKLMNVHFVGEVGEVLQEGANG